jgi:hypothetical protein
VPPFSPEEFFEVFTLYNQAVWPAQVFFLLLAVAATGLALKGRGWAGRTVFSILGVLWLWMGVAYHWMFFTRVNTAAWAFGALFVAQGLLLFWFGLRGDRARFAPGGDLFTWAGGALILYGLVLYPLLGMALGHRYPAQPTFGLPCPTTIFTVGILLWARPKVPWALLVVPAVWSVIGFSAVRFFGVLEDAVLPVAGILGGGLILWKNRRAGEGMERQSLRGGGLT